MNFRLSVDKINIALLYKQINSRHQTWIDISSIYYKLITCNVTHIIRYINKNCNMQKKNICIKVLVIHYQFNGAIFFGFAPALSSASH